LVGTVAAQQCQLQGRDPRIQFCDDTSGFSQGGRADLSLEVDHVGHELDHRGCKGRSGGKELAHGRCVIALFAVNVVLTTIGVRFGTGH
jgi:hypothetical protein